MEVIKAVMRMNIEKEKNPKRDSWIQLSDMRAAHGRL